jgi:hypothetical protein
MPLVIFEWTAESAKTHKVVTFFKFHLQHPTFFFINEEARE